MHAYTFGLNQLPTWAKGLLRHGEKPLAWEMATLLGADKRSARRTEEGSWAQRCAEAFPGNGGLLLTSQRLGLLEYSLTQPDQEPLWIPRKEVPAMRRAPGLLRSGRIAIDFSDGTTLRPTLGIVSGRSARRFLQA